MNAPDAEGKPAPTADDTGIPNDVDHEYVRVLRRHFPSVHRLRKSPYSTDVMRSEGEDIWVVGPYRLRRSSMIALAKQHMEAATGVKE